MELRTYLTALRKGWWIVLACAVIGGGAGAFMAERATPLYAAHVTFYVSTPQANSSTAFSTDQFAQAKANSYASILSSNRLGKLIVDATGLKMSPGAVAGEISGSAELNTVIVSATVTDSSPQRALTIARGAADQLPRLVNVLDNTSTGTHNVSLQVVDDPTVGSTPVSPRKKLDVGLGLIFGLIVGVVGAVLRQLLDTSVRTDEALQEVVGAPVLATINFDPEAKSQPLLVGETTHSPRGEAVRRLRTNLQFVSAARTLQTLVVTSSVGSEGKSLTSTNLALVMSDAGRRVLLIEADLRRPSLTDYFDMERAAGLTNALAGQVALDEVIQRWGETNVSILASGPLPPNPSELLGSAAMQRLLAEVRSRFDLIIIDSPPLLPVTDAAVLATEADGVLMIFRYGKTSRTQLASAVRALSAVDAHIAGAVTNMKPISRSEKRSYGDYSQYGAAPVPVERAKAVEGTRKNRRSRRAKRQAAAERETDRRAPAGEVRSEKRATGEVARRR